MSGDLISLDRARKRIVGGEHLEELADRADWIETNGLALAEVFERLADAVRAEALGRGDKRSRDRKVRDVLSALSTAHGAVASIYTAPKKRGRKARAAEEPPEASA